MRSNLILEIPKPCQQEWSKMTPDANGRFCAHCQQRVVDFTRMTDGQILAYLKEGAASSSCGRLRQSQLDRMLTEEVLSSRQARIRWGWAAFVAGTLSLFRAEAQPVTGSPVRSVVIQHPAEAGIVHQQTDTVRTFDIKGRVTDQYGEGLTGAVVSLKGTSRGVVTGLDGCFVLKAGEHEFPAALLVSFVGFATSELALPTRDSIHSLLITMEPDTEVLMGEVVVVGYIGVKRKALPDWKFRSITKAKDSIQGLTLFPNPARPGAVISLKGLGFGEYRVGLVHASGETIFEERIHVEKGNLPAKFSLPAEILPGVYRIAAFHTRTKKITTAALLIE
jgi:hypothetical protein